MLDRTGTGDHFQVTVASPRFDGLPLLEQHRLVNQALAAPLADGTIHELRIKTKGTRMSDLSGNIKQVIDGEPVALFMKGTPEMAMCGNSMRALEALRRAGAPVSAVNILPDPAIREELSAQSGWPTIPQIFVGGELIGGADIVEELEASRRPRADARGEARPGLPRRARGEDAHRRLSSRTSRTRKTGSVASTISAAVP